MAAMYFVGKEALDLYIMISITESLNSTVKGYPQ
jgi:hypothetical protein